MNEPGEAPAQAGNRVIPTIEMFDVASAKDYLDAPLTISVQQ
ncbi:hypothetical protein QM646_03250 [Rhodococcus erythropolis]|nr:hypothetical protein [Rhodococcus erythropolis]